MIIERGAILRRHIMALLDRVRESWEASEGAEGGPGMTTHQVALALRRTLPRDFERVRGDTLAALRALRRDGWARSKGPAGSERWWSLPQASPAW